MVYKWLFTGYLPPVTIVTEDRKTPIPEKIFIPGTKFFFGGFLQTLKRKKCVDMIYVKIFRNL